MNSSTYSFLALSLALTFAGAADAANILVPQQAATINAGLAMAGPGGTVTVDEGTYHENVVMAFDNQTLRGDGNVKVDAGGGAGLIVPIGVTGCVIDDMQFRDCSMGMLIAGMDTEVSDCKVKNTTSHGIFVLMSNVRIEDTSVKDAALNGIYIGASSCVVYKCQIARTGEAGVLAFGDFNSILGTTIRETGHQGIQIGDDAVGADGNLVQLCNISLTGWDGIELRRMASGCTINENEIYDTTNDAIDIRWLSDGHSLTKNVIHNAGDAGIEVDGANATISRNKVYNSWDDGICLESDADNGMYFKNKVMFSMDDGFYVAGAGNTFTRNKGKFSLGLDRFSFVPMAANIYVDNVFFTSN
ncbi:MAG: right-handed parallel beta-helix repeat-containing protein [Planctomycetes bacterium]|nr:right-handed parallel beta-helix repeat-containing protein [Planctomycetota bacterium]